MKQKKKLSRRAFVKTAGGAVAAAIGFPTLIPSQVFAQKGENSPNNKIVIGCIGMGGMGTGNLRSFLELSGAKVVAVCDVWKPHREKAVKRVKEATGKDPFSCSRFADLLARPEVDAVIIATPDHAHSPVLAAAARAKKHAY